MKKYPLVRNYASYIQKSVVSYGISLLIMSFTALSLLLVLSLLTFYLKWQGSRVMCGIILTYMIAGFVGGFFLRQSGKNTEKYALVLLRGFFLGILFMIMLNVLSVIVTEWTIRGANAPEAEGAFPAVLDWTYTVCVGLMIGAAGALGAVVARTQCRPA